MLAKMQRSGPLAWDRGGGEVKVRVCSGRQAGSSKNIVVSLPWYITVHLHGLSRRKAFVQT
jgi:hypothetical protein